MYKVREQRADYSRALPILTIYFLGYRLNQVDAPVIKVKRKYYDVISGEVLAAREEFIESLTHDSFVIQIPFLKGRFKSDLEKILSVFDQSLATSDSHILEIDETAYPARYRQVIRRLQQAIAEPKVRQTMELEDEILEDLQNKERTIEEKDKALEENRKAIEEKDMALEEKDKALAEKERVIAELQKRPG